MPSRGGWMGTCHAGGPRTTQGRGGRMRHHSWHNEGAAMRSHHWR
jgi:hypothetical protein